MTEEGIVIIDGVRYHTDRPSRQGLRVWSLHQFLHEETIRKEGELRCKKDVIYKLRSKN